MAVEIANAVVSLTVSAKGIGADLDRELGKPAQDAANKAGAGASKSFGDSFSSVSGSLTKVGTASVAAAGLVGTALFKAAGSFTDLAISAGKMANTTGLAVDDASRWTEVAADMGIEAGTLEGSFNKMNLTAGKTPEKFAAFGVEIARTKAGTVDVNQTFLNTVDRLNAIKDPAEKAEAATALLGKGWTGMSELIATGSDSLKTSLAAVSEAKVINPDELAKAKEMRAGLDSAKDSIEDLVLSIGSGAAPMITTLATGFGNLVGLVSHLNEVTDGAAGGFLAIGAVGVGLLGTLSLVAGQVLKMKDRFSQVGDIMSSLKGKMTDAEGGLSGLGKAAAGLGAALGIAGVAFAIYETVQESAEKQQRLVAARAVEIADALKIETDAILTLRDAAAGTAGKLDAETAAHTALNKALLAGDGDGAKLARTLGELGMQTTSAADAVISMKTNTSGFIDTLVDGQPALKGVADDVKENIKASDDWGEVMTGLSYFSKNLTDEQKNLIHSIENLQDVTENTDFGDMVSAFFAEEVGASKAKAALVQQAKATVDSSNATDDSLEAYQNYLGLLADMDPAQRNATDATNAATEAANKSTVGQHMSADAMAHAEDAARGTADAAQLLADKTALAEQTTRNYEAAWDSLTGKLNSEQAYINLAQQVDNVSTAATKAWDAQIAANEATAKGADDAVAKQQAAEDAQRAYQSTLIDTKQKIIDIGKQIGLTPEEVSTLLKLTDDGQIAVVEQRLKDLEKSRTVDLFLVTHTGVQHGGGQAFAAGTTNALGGPSLVGEHGPEIRNLNAGDTITPAPETMRILRGSMLAMSPNSAGNGRNGPLFGDVFVSNDVDADGFFRLANFHMAGV